MHGILALVAQRIRHLTSNQGIAGSNPAEGFPCYKKYIFFEIYISYNNIFLFIFKKQYNR